MKKTELARLFKVLRAHFPDITFTENDVPDSKVSLIATAPGGLASNIVTPVFDYVLRYYSTLGYDRPISDGVSIKTDDGLYHIGLGAFSWNEHNRLYKRHAPNYMSCRATTETADAIALKVELMRY